MNIKAVYGKKIMELLEKYSIKMEPLSKNGFFLFENLEENAFLFIGINPSEVKEIEKKYNIKKENNIYWAKEEFKDEYPFYQHFNDLSCGIKWSHLDLYFTCIKSQKDLEKMDNNIFLKEQFDISIEIIKKLAPKIIVVGNAYASGLIQKHFTCNFNNEIGTYIIKQFNNIPIFFSGMFTGQRALDKGSRERLKWHINFVRGKLKEGII
jgi:hypothetical protein